MEGTKMFAAATCLDQAVCCALNYGAAFALSPSPSGVESLTRIWVLAGLRWALIRLFCAVPKSGSDAVLNRYLATLCLLGPVFESAMLALFGKHPEHWSGSLSSPEKALVAVAATATACLFWEMNFPDSRGESCESANGTEGTQRARALFMRVIRYSKPDALFLCGAFFFLACAVICVHTFQHMYGCEWDDESGDTGGFWQQAYDGKDVLVYELKNERYIAVAPQAFITAHRWNGNPAGLEHRKYYLTQYCVEWLKKYWSYGRSTLERTVTPEVFLLQKEPSSPITCFATGFYPRAVVVMWQKNGWDLYEDTELGEILPNMDGTYQIRSRLTVGPEEWKSNEYTCTVMHKSLEQDIVLSVREENIRSNRKNKNGMYIIITCVLGALTLALTGIGVGIWIWKKRSGYRETSIADPDSGNSSPPAVELSPQ